MSLIKYNGNCATVPNYFVKIFLKFTYAKGSFSSTIVVHRCVIALALADKKREKKQKKGKKASAELGSLTKISVK